MQEASLPKRGVLYEGVLVISEQEEEETSEEVQLRNGDKKLSESLRQLLIHNPFREWEETEGKTVSKEPAAVPKQAPRAFMRPCKGESRILRAVSNCRCGQCMA